MAGERCFVAVVPPPPVVAAWEAHLDPRRDAEPDFRWTVAEGWHLTLAFMAAVPSRLLEPVEESLSQVAARTRRFDLAVSGAGAFPDPDRARALWLGVSAGAEPLGALATRCRTAIAGCGVEVDGGRFRPHLTIARTRPVRARRWLTILDAAPAQQWRVDGFVLLRSRLLPGGAGYETIAEFPFAEG